MIPCPEGGKRMSKNKNPRIEMIMAIIAIIVLVAGISLSVFFGIKTTRVEPDMAAMKAAGPSYIDYSYGSDLYLASKLENRAQGGRIIVIGCVGSILAAVALWGCRRYINNRLVRQPFMGNQPKEQENQAEDKEKQ